MVHPVVGRCPVCGDALEITRLHCRQCDTVVEGHFYGGWLQRLSAEQLAFAETFIRCEGKINRVEEELGLSYPTVRNRLNELIRALGYSVADPPVLTSAERKAVLQQLAAGQITSAEAEQRLAGGAPRRG